MRTAFFVLSGVQSGALLVTCFDGLHQVQADLLQISMDNVERFEAVTKFCIVRGGLLNQVKGGDAAGQVALDGFQLV